MEDMISKNGVAMGASPNQTGKPTAVATGGGALSSPLPPEPSPITPLPQEEGASAKSKSKLALNLHKILYIHINFESLVCMNV